jgi:bifunctional non-homologous end joining protein LigD
VFDILFLDGKDMRRKPLLERKALLKQVLPSNSLLRYSKHIKAKGTALFKKAKQAGLEGVMAKRAAGLYYSGKRTREWLKFKAMNEQEVVIVGYTAPRRSRKYFGALVLAVRTGQMVEGSVCHRASSAPLSWTSTNSARRPQTNAH